MTKEFKIETVKEMAADFVKYFSKNEDQIMIDEFLEGMNEEYFLINTTEIEEALFKFGTFKAINLVLENTEEEERPSYPSYLSPIFISQGLYSILLEEVVQEIAKSFDISKSMETKELIELLEAD